MSNNVKVERFSRVINAFNFVYDRKIGVADGEIIIRMPPVTPYARSINDIAYVKTFGIKLYGTIAHDIDEPDTPWIEISDGHDINKCTSALKIVVPEDAENTENQHVCIRVNMN